MELLVCLVQLCHYCYLFSIVFCIYRVGDYLINTLVHRISTKHYHFHRLRCLLPPELLYEYLKQSKLAGSGGSSKRLPIKTHGPTELYGALLIDQCPKNLLLPYLCNVTDQGLSQDSFFIPEALDRDHENENDLGIGETEQTSDVLTIFDVYTLESNSFEPRLNGLSTSSLSTSSLSTSSLSNCRFLPGSAPVPLGTSDFRFQAGLVLEDRFRLTRIIHELGQSWETSYNVEDVFGEHRRLQARQYILKGVPKALYQSRKRSIRRIGSRTVTTIDHDGKKFVIFVPDEPEGVGVGSEEGRPESHNDEITNDDLQAMSAKSRARGSEAARNRQRARRQRKREERSAGIHDFVPPGWIRKLSGSWFRPHWKVVESCQELKATGMVLREEDLRPRGLYSIPLFLHHCRRPFCLSLFKYTDLLAEHIHGLESLQSDASSHVWNNCVELAKEKNGAREEAHLHLRLHIFQLEMMMEVASLKAIRLGILYDEHWYRKFGGWRLKEANQSLSARIKGTLAHARALAKRNAVRRYLAEEELAGKKYHEEACQIVREDLNDYLRETIPGWLFMEA